MGTVANMPPMPVATINSEVAKVSRPGNQIEAVLIPAIKLADIPTPMSIHPRTKKGMLSAQTSYKAPKLAMARNRLVTALGP